MENWEDRIPVCNGYYWYKETDYSIARIVEVKILNLHESFIVQKYMTDGNGIITQYNPKGVWIGPLFPGVK